MKTQKLQLIIRENNRDINIYHAGMQNNNM